MRQQIDKKNITYEPYSKSDVLDCVDLVIIALEFCNKYDGSCGLDIPLGNYKISTILKLIENQFYINFGIFKNSILTRNFYQYRVEINQTVMFEIAWFAERLCLGYLHLDRQHKCLTTLNTSFKTLQKQTVKFFIFDPNNYIQELSFPLIKRISNIHVYSNIVELSSVNNS